MRISDLLSVCLRNLTRRRVRTALTVIGVVIGVCAIILMVSLGIGARESMMQMLQEWGDLTIINVYNYGGGETKLDDKALSKIQAMDHVQIATPFYSSRVSFRLKSRNGRYAAYTNIIGIYPEAFDALGYKLSDGTSFADSKRITAWWRAPMWRIPSGIPRKSAITMWIATRPTPWQPQKALCGYDEG